MTARARKRAASAAGLSPAIESARAIVCAGSGGVGKTTLSAALAVAAAAAGRRTLVLTIDPARRLADAFGLDEIGCTPTPVDLGRILGSGKRRGAKAKAASLDAMMLDPKPTFDALVDRFAESEAARRRILDNRIYQHLSETLAGSTEYAAMVQVHELVEAGAYDLIVVDTPPADHALDFLRAPRRMREFLEGRFVRTLVQPAYSATRFGAQLVGRGLKRLMSLIDRVAGGGFLEDITEFLGAVDGLALGFEEKSRRVEDFLLGPDTRFVLVSGVQSRAVAGALDFLGKLDEFRVPLAAVLVNRMRPWPFEPSPAELAKRLASPEAAQEAVSIAGAEEGPVLTAMLREAVTLQRAQEAAAEGLAEAAKRRGVECLRLNEFGRALASEAGLREMAEALRRGE